MHLRYITCSDPRAHNSFDEMFNLWNVDERVEVAVQMHPGKVSPGTERYQWIMDLLDNLYCNPSRYNFAVHVNQGWCHSICNGYIPEELKPIFNKNWLFLPGRPLVQRVQLNMPKATADSLDPYKLKSVIDAFPNKEFILQYNDKTKVAVDNLHKIGAHFSLLYDASGGNGISPDSWQKPVYNEHDMGYAGGLGPDNITDNLEMIKSVARFDSVWIDAEGKLKTDNKFDVARAQQYVLNAKTWIEKQR